MVQTIHRLKPTNDNWPWFAQPRPGLSLSKRARPTQLFLPYSNILSEKMPMFIFYQIFHSKKCWTSIDLETPSFCKGGGLVTVSVMIEYELFKFVYLIVNRVKQTWKSDFVDLWEKYKYLTANCLTERGWPSLLST